MSVASRRAVAAAVLACCLAAAATAGAAEPRLVAQIAQVAQAGGPGDQPPLTRRPPRKLSGDSGDATDPAGDDGAGTPRADGSLASTGSEAAMLALAGFGLLGWGVALRLRLRDAA